MKLHEIIRVIPKQDLILRITFGCGEERLFDAKPYLRGDLFSPLRDEHLFRQAGVSREPRGVAWPNGATLCADMLYMNSVAVA